METSGMVGSASGDKIESRAEKVFDRSVQLTDIEKLMLDHLLEKERNGRRRSAPGPSLVKERMRRVEDLSWCTSFESSPRTSGRQSLSREDRSVIKAMDGLNRLSDEQLMRLLRQCDDENSGFDPDGPQSRAGDLLAWYVTRSKLDTSRRSEIESKTSRQTPMLKAASFEPNPKRSAKNPSRPKPIRGAQGRILFFFMREPPTVQDPLGPIDEEAVDDCEDVPADPSVSHVSHVSLKLPPGKSERSDFEDGVKLGKSERHRSRRTVLDEDEEAEEGSFCSDLEDVPPYLADLVQSRKPMSKKKSREEDISLWDPSKPRPMPRRLRRRVPVSKVKADQKPRTSKEE